MASMGLNIDRNGSTTLETIRSLSATWVRIVAMPEFDHTEYFRNLRVNGIKILLVFARESGSDFARHKALYGHLVTAIQVGNEPEGADASSWKMSRDELVDLGRRVRAVFPRPFPLICAGMASGHSEWLEGVDLSWADGLGVHGYLKDAPNPGDIEDLPDLPDLLETYRPYGKPLFATEWGWWAAEESRAVEEVRDMANWAAKTGDVEVFFYFCVSDQMVPPFGLLHTDGFEKPRAREFREAASLAIHSLWPEIVAPPTEPPVTDLRAYARAAAVRNGYPPLHFERQIQQESGFDPAAFNASSGASGIAQIIPRFHPGVDPWDPIASLDYAASWMAALRKQFGSYRKAIAAYNWGPGNVSTWDGSPSTLPRETRHYLDIIMGPGWPEPDAGTPTGHVTYNRNEPVHAQEETFDCSQESLEWALWAYGRETSDDWLESTMIAEGVMTRELGLMDASGAGLAAFIRRQYGELKYDSNNTSPVSFEALMAEFEAPSNPYPGLIGGSAWNHWAGLRTADPQSGLLLLANPSDGHKGVRQTMSRQQFSALGPFSLVRVIHADVLKPTKPTEPPVPPVVLPTRAEVIALATRHATDWATIASKLPS